MDGALAALFATLDVLDLGPLGEAAFTSALEGYGQEVDVIEEQLARPLRDTPSYARLVSLLVSFLMQCVSFDGGDGMIDHMFFSSYCDGLANGLPLPPKDGALR